MRDSSWDSPDGRRGRPRLGASDERASGKRTRASRLGLFALAAAALSGCSSAAARFGLPEAASDRAGEIGSLWSGAWVASLVIGVFVWGLIGWAVIRYRRKDADPATPRQTQYHLPLELLYTLVPFLVIGVLFFYTVQAQDKVLARTKEPAHVISVIGQKWSWTFSYLEAGDPAIGQDAHEGGTPNEIPDLYLPVGEPVRFELASPDVIHSFWIPSFYFKMDVIPGHPNQFDVTPNRVGVYDGRCAELCGQDHAAMVFTVHVVSPEAYRDHVRSLIASGGAGAAPLPEGAGARPGSPEPQEER